MKPLNQNDNPGGGARVSKHVFISLARHELKYTIAPELMDPIRAFLRPYCRMDEHAAREKEGFYTITCLYLDDDRYRMFWDAEERAPVRAKLRVRGYGEAPHQIVKFEIKRRIDDLVVKSSVTVPGDSWVRLLSAPAETASLSLDRAQRNALEMFLLTARTLGAGPKMLVRYERQAFHSLIDNYVRITFDRRLVHQPMTACDLTGTPRNWKAIDDLTSMGFHTSGVVLELKFLVVGAPPWIADLVRTFHLERRGYSKYGCAVRRSVLGGEPAWDLAPVMSRRRDLGGRTWTS